MSTSRTETAPGTWDDARDEAFFRITAHLLTPDVCLGATVLLASYDDEVGARHLDPAPAVAARSVGELAGVPRARRAAA